MSDQKYRDTYKAEREKLGLPDTNGCGDKTTTSKPGHTATMCNICFECLCHRCKNDYINGINSHNALVKACKLGLNNTIAADDAPELAIDLTEDIKIIKSALRQAGEE